jgi:trehalose 6-phosphate phosphatase
MGRCLGLRSVVLVWVAAAEAAAVVAASGPRQTVLALPSNMVPSPVTSKGHHWSSSSATYISRPKLVEVVNGLLGVMNLPSTCAIPYEHSAPEEVAANNAWLVSVHFGFQLSRECLMQRILQFCPSLQAKYPSALASFDQIITNAQGKKIALFLDYDGTLSPMVNDPVKAFMSPEVTDMLDKHAYY